MSVWSKLDSSRRDKEKSHRENIYMQDPRQEEDMIVFCKILASGEIWLTAMKPVLPLGKEMQMVQLSRSKEEDKPR